MLNEVSYFKKLHFFFYIPDPKRMAHITIEFSYINIHNKRVVHENYWGIIYEVLENDYDCVACFIVSFICKK